MLAQEIQGVYEAICEGLRKESLCRGKLHEEAKPNENLLFSLDEEREIGTAAVLCTHLRNLGFFTRMDWYFDGNNSLLRPDLAVWLPDSRRLLFLELKRVGQGYPYKGLRRDIKKLDNISVNPKNSLNGLLVIGFSIQKTNWEYLNTALSSLQKEYPRYQLQGRFTEVNLAEMDGCSARQS